MTENVGYAALQVIPSFKGFDSALEKGVAGPFSAAGTSQGARFGDAAGKSAGRRFGGAFSASVRTVGALGLGALAFKIGKDSVAAASDLNESLNAVNVTYGKQAQAVKALGEDAADALGLSNTEFNGLAVQFSSFAGTVAGKGGDVVGVLDDLTTRGADFASVMNLEVNEAMGLFQSGLAGETEPLRRFGIDLSAAAVEAHAYKAGIAAAGEELTESQKVQARYSLLMKQTAKTQGDFTNTSDQLANSQRRLTANWENAQARLGKALLPVLTDAVNFLVDEGVPAFEKAADFFTDDFAPAVSDLAGDLKPAARALGEFVGFLNDLPSEAKIAALAGIVGGGAFLKLRGGGAGALGAAGSALGLAKPVPVLVTNPGFGATGVGGGLPGAGKTGRLGAAAKGVGTYAGPLAALGYSVYGVGQQLDRSTDKFPDSKPSDFGYLNDGYVEMTSAAADARKAADEMFSSFGTIVKGASMSVANIVDAYDVLPKKLTTEFVTEGVPKSRGEAQALVKQYDLTPKQKETLFNLLGFETTMSRARQIEAALDRAARAREARINVTTTYSRRGYETRGGLQEGGGTTTTQTGQRSAQRTYDSERRFDRRMNDRD